MRVARQLCITALAVTAFALVSAAPAAAQSNVFEPTSGTAAIRTRSEGSITPPRLVMPRGFTELRLNFRLAFTRFLAQSGWTSRTLDSAIPADLPTRRRSL